MTPATRDWHVFRNRGIIEAVLRSGASGATRVVRQLVRIHDNGTLTLPAAVRRRHNLNAGDLVTVEETDRGVLITREAAEEPMSTEHEVALFAKPSPAEIARRQALFAQVMAHRQERDIKPLTTTELIHLARAEEGSTDDPGT
jgi:AbrB family looped-hinge helix DNA binding protein